MEMTEDRLKIIFWGTPFTAVPFLQYLFEREDVVGVVTRPDRPVGRGQKFHQTPVADAVNGRCPLEKPADLRGEGFRVRLRSFQPDLSVVVAYGRILPEEHLAMPRLGCINIHFSLLPKYRGAAPIQHALLNGDRETGVTIFSLRRDLDAGPVYCRKKISIMETDNAVTLTARLIDAGRTALKETILLLKEGSAEALPQSGQVSRAPVITKADGKINWQTAASTVSNKIRALVGWPCAYTLLPGGKSLKVTAAHVVPLPNGPVSVQGETFAPGTITDLVKGKGFIVQCSGESILVERVIPEGKKEIAAWAFVNGRGCRLGDIFK